MLPLQVHDQIYDLNRKSEFSGIIRPKVIVHLVELKYIKDSDRMQPTLPTNLDLMPGVQSLDRMHLLALFWQQVRWLIISWVNHHQTVPRLEMCFPGKLFLSSRSHRQESGVVVCQLLSVCIVLCAN